MSANQKNTAYKLAIAFVTLAFAIPTGIANFVDIAVFLKEHISERLATIGMTATFIAFFLLQILTKTTLLNKVMKVKSLIVQHTFKLHAILFGLFLAFVIAAIMRVFADNQKVEKVDFLREIRVSDTLTKTIRIDQIDSLFTIPIAGLQYEVFIRGGEEFIVSSCNDYFKLKNLKFDFNSQQEINKSNKYTEICELLSYAKSANNSEISFISSSTLNNIELMPLEILKPLGYDINMELNKSALENISINDWIKAEKIKVNSILQNEIELELGNDIFTIKEMLRSDINGDGYEDSFIIINQSIVDGSYEQTDIVVLTRTKSDGLFVTI